MSVPLPARGNIPAAPANAAGDHVVGYTVVALLGMAAGLLLGIVFGQHGRFRDLASPVPHPRSLDSHRP